MDIERTMEFLLAQQARFAEQQERFAEQQAQLAERHAQLDERQREHEQRQAKFEEDLLRAGALLVDVANAQEQTNEILVTLAQRQVQTEENLHILMATVERHISNHN